jgi:hypothetical protein
VISAATIRPVRPAGMPSVFWQETWVRSFKDIAVTCLCRWHMTFVGRRVSGWVLWTAAPRCPYHGKQVAR